MLPCMLPTRAWRRQPHLRDLGVFVSGANSELLQHLLRCNPAGGGCSKLVWEASVCCNLALTAAGERAGERAAIHNNTCSCSERRSPQLQGQHGEPAGHVAVAHGPRVGACGQLQHMCNPVQCGGVIMSVTWLSQTSMSAHHQRRQNRRHQPGMPASQCTPAPSHQPLAALGMRPQGQAPV